VTRRSGGLQPLLLLAGELLGALLLGHVDHRAHPADVPALVVDQRGFDQEGVEALATLAHQADFQCLGRRVAAQDLLMDPAGLFDGLRRPVGHRRLHADQLFGAPADHPAEGRVHVGDTAVQVAGAHAGLEGVFHRLAEGVLAAQGLLGRLAALHVATQLPQAPHDGGGEHAEGAHQEQGNPAHLAFIGGDDEVEAVAGRLEGDLVGEGGQRRNLGLGGDLDAQVVGHRDPVALGEPPGHLPGQQGVEGIHADDSAQVAPAFEDRLVDLELGLVFEDGVGLAINRPAEGARQTEGRGGRKGAGGFPHHFMVGEGRRRAFNLAVGV
jgi:hypothetical protein